MALIICKECGKEIAKTAKKCPACGASNKQGSSIPQLSLLIILGALIYAAVNYSEPESLPADQAVSAPRPEPKPRASWRLSETINPKDDSNTVVMSLTPISGRSRYGKPFTLVARCKSNKTELYTVWHEYLGDDSSDVYDEWKLVTVRVGNAPATEQRWGVSSDRKATFSNSAIPLLRKIAKSNKLYIETTPYNENPHIAIYDTTGIQEPIERIAKVCSWSL